MAQHLCIVSRDNPLLLGYLNIALGYLTAGGDELEIVIDRRPDPESDEVAPAVALEIEQRRLHGVDGLLRTRGYAIVSRDAGEEWRVSNASPPMADEQDELGDDTADPAALAPASAPARRRLLVAGVAAAVVVVAASVAISSDALGRVAGAVAWLRSTPVPEIAARESLAPPARPVPPPTLREPTRTAELTPPPVTSDAPARAARALEVSPAPAPATPPAPAPASESATRAAPTTIAKAAPPPAQAQAPRRAVEPVPSKPTSKAAAKAETKPEVKPEARPETKPEPKPDPKVATAAAATTVSEAPPEFSGVPRLEMRRERDASGRTAAITVRVTDPGGRPLPAADVRILRRLAGGGVQETRLESVSGDGSYRGAFPAPSATSNGLSMRVTVGRVSHEVPLAE
jgi:hypothetical protein